MKTKIKTRYEYDPVRRRLIIFEGSRTRGGFHGDTAEMQYRKLQEKGEPVKLVCMDEIVQKSKVRQIRAIWKTLGIDDMREVILESYGVDSTKDLSEQQLDELIAEYGSKLRSHPNAKTDDPEKRRLISLVLTTLNSLGVYVTNNDWKAVNNYIMSARFAKYDRFGRPKLLYQMTSDELTTLHKQLRAVIAWRNKNAAEMVMLTQMN